MTERTARFASDNASGVHPAVLEWIARVNSGYALGYGHDRYTAQAEAAFEAVFGSGIHVYPVGIGTANNVLALAAAAAPTDAIFCSELAHINVDECSAPEHFLGCKLIPIACHEGKLDPAALAAKITWQDDPFHRARPRVLSITQATEYGTLYSITELKTLIDLAHGHGLKVHLDGARVANAAAALDLPLKALTRDLGVDVLSFGGTKNGLMMAEAVVVFEPALAERMDGIRKQGMQLASKHRYYAAQYLAYFEHDLWRQNAAHANQMGAYLGQQLAALEGVRLSHSVEVNMVFAHVPPAWLTALERYAAFEVWDRASGEIRLVTSFSTTPEEVDEFIAAVKRIARAAR